MVHCHYETFDMAYIHLFFFDFVLNQGLTVTLAGSGAHYVEQIVL